jgi:hypothetical protein
VGDHVDGPLNRKIRKLPSFLLLPSLKHTNHIPNLCLERVSRPPLLLLLQSLPPPGECVLARGWLLDILVAVLLGFEKGRLYELEFQVGEGAVLVSDGLGVICHVGYAALV